jgi:hypothetical protein
MFRVDFGSGGRYCDGLTRRSFLQLGVAGMASVGLPQLLRARSESAGKSGSKKASGEHWKSDSDSASATSSTDHSS